MSVESEVKRGKDALVYFHNEALGYPENYRLSHAELCQKVQDMSHGRLLEGLGFAIEQTGFGDYQVKSAMVKLAQQGQGKIPTRFNDFITCLSGEIENYSFSDMANEVLKGTARDLAAGVQEAGNVTIQTLKNASGYITLLPLVGFLGVIGYVWFRVKK